MSSAVTAESADRDKDKVVGTQLSSYSQGKRLVISVTGSRGDIQPMIALGSFLQASGFDILITTQVENVGFVEKFGLKVAGCHWNVTEFMAKDKDLAAGNLFRMIKNLNRISEEHFPRDALKEWEAIKEFQPDILCCSFQNYVQGETFAQALQIPCVVLWLFPPLVPTAHHKSPLNEPCCHYLAWLFIFKMTGSMNAPKMAVLKDLVANDIAADEFLPLDYVTFLHEFVQPIAPYITAQSSSLHTIPGDAPLAHTSKVKLTGFWVVSREEQQRRLKRQDTKFGGRSLGPLQDFIDAGEPPAYIGWGSLIAISAEHMACVAVRSLMKAGLRGIILGGLAQLEAKHLDGQPDSAEMHEYSAKNVLFVSTAPHEWLFPQCMATVHHGGMGTVAAALRAGVPTIVTPCAFDQFDNAKMVSKTGAGIALEQLHKVTPEAVSKALLRCQADEELIRTAATLGEKLRGEDGLTAAAQAIDRFLQEEVATGQWAVAMKRRIQKRKESVARPPSICRFLCRALFGNPFSSHPGVEVGAQTPLLQH
eukprot:CAMPEP_0168502594 /NCGR_PEP_ID=MMETSP0228-20121227/75418_1 /TAXON_ID=133427 /ORGANISM="Protoceratium reticulatum, Strain CCCM 535 (=CCMP 1889)" /LENGTH=535 /DNA_ID=CAMNT_0008519619 /DNA_START=66 /DNA_END=1673 /DNA_ORIENTATION=+